MKIGICRFSQRFDIDFYAGSASALGTDLRVQMIEGLVELGHEVHILSVVPDDQLWLFDRPETHPIYDYRFMDKVWYSPVKVPELDMLIVECSTTNARFGGVNLIRFAEIMRAPETRDLHCILYQHGDVSSEIGVALGEMYMWGGDTSYTPNKEEPSHFRDYFWDIDPQRQNHRWDIWTHTPHPERIQAIERPRHNYAKYAAHAFFLPLGRSANFDRPLCRVPEEEKVGIIYVGREKSPARTRRLEELAGTGNCCTRLLYGKWNVVPDGWYYGGFVEGHGRVYELLPHARCTISISDKWFYKTGMLTTRLVQASSAGIAGFVDGEWESAIESGMFGPASMINSHDDIHLLLNAYPEIAAAQRERLKPWAENLGELLSVHASP